MRKWRLVTLISVAVLAILVLVGVLLARQGAFEFSAVESQSGQSGHSGPPSTPESWRPRELVSVQSDPEDALTPSRVLELWQPFGATAEYEEWTTWGYVIDADTGEVLLDQSGSDPHVPASTMKVLTAMVALDSLPVTETLSTGVSLVESGLYLWGEGDLLLTAGPGEPGVDGHAGLEDLAALTVKELEEQGLHSVSLTYQTELFDGDKRLAAWREQEVEEYAGDVGPYAIHTGRVAPGVWDFVDDSALEVAESFAGSLAERGIAVTAIMPGETPDDAAPIAEVESAPLFEQIGYLLAVSDNTLAEQYCHLSARAAGATTTFGGSAANLQEQLDDAGLDTGVLVVDDCSGLSLENKIEPRLLVETMAESTRGSSEAQELVRLLPRGGVNGTMTDRFETPLAVRNVQAKTGSLGAVAALAGVATTRSGQNLLFAVGVDDAAEWTAYYAREPMDNFIASLLE